MLVLKRNPGEAIRIGDGIVVTLLDVSGQSATIGIDAPREVVILRDDAVHLNPKVAPCTP